MKCCWRLVCGFLVASVFGSASSELICGEGRNETEIVYSGLDFPHFFTAQVDGGKEWFCSENATDRKRRDTKYLLNNLVTGMCGMNDNFCSLKNYTGNFTLQRECKDGYRRVNPDGFCRIPDETLNCSHPMMKLFPSSRCKYGFTTFLFPQNFQGLLAEDFPNRHMSFLAVSTWNSPDNTVSVHQSGYSHVRFNTYRVKGVDVRTANCVRLIRRNIPVIRHSWMHTVERELSFVDKSLMEIVSQDYSAFFDALERVNISQQLNESRVTVFVYTNTVMKTLPEPRKDWLQRHILTDSVLCRIGFDDESRTSQLGDGWRGTDLKHLTFTRTDIMGVNGVLHEVSHPIWEIV